MSDAPNSRENVASNDWLAVGVGLFFFVAFFGLRETTGGLHIFYYGDQSVSSPGELRFWLASTFLLLPGAGLIGYGLSGWMGASLHSIWKRLGNLTQQEKRMGLFLLGVLVFFLARLGRTFFLLDLPITDDEYAARWGGQVMAMGKLSIPTPELISLYPRLFLRTFEGQLSSFDFPGLQAIWALGEMTSLGSSIFLIFPVLFMCSIVYALYIQLGARWACVGAVLSLCSPMIFSLSMTSHVHSASRGLLALTLCLYVLADKKQTLVRWSLVGLAFGILSLTRTFESFVLMLPLFVYPLSHWKKNKNYVRTTYLGLLLGGFVPFILWAFHNYYLTGKWWYPARLALDFFSNMQARPTTLWMRFGGNLSQNLLMLMIWFLGPIGLVLLVKGIRVNRWTRLLGIGVLLHLCMALLHIDIGLHIVGPIHYSESSVFLIWIATYGLREWSQKQNWTLWTKQRWAGSLLCMLFLGLGTFTFWNGLALQRQAHIQKTVYDFVENPKLGKAIVLAPKYADVWTRQRRFAGIGSWIFDWRPPSPTKTERVMILHHSRTALPHLRKLYPDRTLYRLHTLPRAPYMNLIPLVKGDTHALKGWNPQPIRYRIRGKSR